MKNDHYAENERWMFYNKHKEEIDTLSLKYFSTFKRWAKNGPIPFRRERLYRYGLVEGIIDRIDRFTYQGSVDKFMITDYKTSNSKPNKEILEHYKTQIGGYCWLLMKTDPDRFNENTLLSPKILIIKKASWNYIDIPEWRLYADDFDGLVKMAAEIILKIVNGKIPEPELESVHCHYCLGKEYCPYIND